MRLDYLNLRFQVFFQLSEYIYKLFHILFIMDYMQEVQGAEEVSGMKTHKVLWFIFFGIIFFIIFLIVFSIFAGGNKNVSDNKLIEGVALEVGESDVIKFDLEKEEHGMTINFIGDGSVEVIISSEPINVSLKINEIKEIDLNNDGIFDIKIRLVSIINERATIAIKKIGNEICQENWECSGWSNCSKGFQKRECHDLNSCDAIFNKPSEIKECLEIEFIENENAFYEGVNNNDSNALNNSINNLNNSVNHSLNNNYSTNLTNHTFASNLTNKTINNSNISIIINNTSNTSNIVTANNYNLTNTTTNSTTICPQNTYICHEYDGFFCDSYYDSSSFGSNSLNQYCCPKKCLKFDSKEQLCSARGYLYFTGNETHICKVQVYSSFNGTNILCCNSIEAKVNLNSGGISTQT